MTAVLIGEMRGGFKTEKPCEDTGGDCIDVATSKGTLGSTGS